MIWLGLCAVLTVTAQVTFDIDLTTLTKPPLWEPTLEEYFPVQRGGEKDEHGLASPVILTSPTNEEFVYHARKGYPIMVSDWAKDMQYDGWTGKDFAEKFPFGYMKAEYIHELKGFKQKEHDTKVIDGELRVNMNFKPDKKKFWYNFTRPASKRYADDPLKPKTGPYVWHVKDELTPKQKTLVQSRFEAPPFLNDPLNKAFMNRTFEIWFSPGSACGAGAHNDGYCESVASIQVRGDKKWRKMLEPKNSFLSSFDEFDGGVYLAKQWAPDLGFINERQGAVIWPPGYLHETRTLQPADGECGAAFTLQFAFPQPVQFLRAFLPRLSLSSEVGQCVKRSWTGYPTIYVSGIKPSHKGDELKKSLDLILSKVDEDKDDKITVEEVKKWFRSRECKVGHEAGIYGREHMELFFQFKAEDTVAYNDIDGDMIVSRQELWDSLVQWSVVRIRVREGLKLVNNADLEGVKAWERSLDSFRREPVSFPNDEGMRPELQQLFSLPKGTKVFKSMKGVGSFSDSEFFSNARDIIEEKYSKYESKSKRAGKKGRSEL